MAQCFVDIPQMGLSAFTKMGQGILDILEQLIVKFMTLQLLTWGLEATGLDKTPSGKKVIELLGGSSFGGARLVGGGSTTVILNSSRGGDILADIYHGSSLHSRARVGRGLIMDGGRLQMAGG
jgi:hypothetical protein